MEEITILPQKNVGAQAASHGLESEIQRDDIALNEEILSALHSAKEELNGPVARGNVTSKETLLLEAQR